MATCAKINHAFKQSHGPLPMARREIMKQLEQRPEVFDMMTSKQLAMVIDLMDIAWKRGTAFKERDICAEGYVWDNNQKSLRELH